MTVARPTPTYSLGHTTAEHERLIRQAARLAPLTERLFRAAGIGPGQRVLDFGSGVGDVAMLAARLVGAGGEVVGIERDVTAIARAQARVAEAGMRNVRFIRGDVTDVPDEPPFDAAVGRFILMFLPDPVAALRAATRSVRPGGVIAFQDPTWAPFLLHASRFPLWSTLVQTLHETFKRSGANTEMGLALYPAFQQAGLPAPTMWMEMLLGTDVEFTNLICEVHRSQRPLAESYGIALEALGDVNTLDQRIRSEISSANAVVSWMGLVSAWSRRPDLGASG